MVLGPVEYMLAEFVDGRFQGEMATALADLVDRGIIRIIDLVFISRDEEGVIIAEEVDSVDEALGGPFASLDGEYGGLLSEEDLAIAAAELPVGAAAGLLVWENLWARDFVAALRNAGGEVVASGRIPAEDVDAAFAALTAE